MITICVTDYSNGIVQVEEFFNLKVSQNGKSDFNFIVDFLWNPELTLIQFCMDGTGVGTGGAFLGVCYVKTLALAYLFDVKDPTDLIITGSVLVVCDNRRVHRSLRMDPSAPEMDKGNEKHLLATSDRRAQVEDDEEGTGAFKLAASLGNPDSATRGCTAGAKAVDFISMVLGAAEQL